MWKPPLTSGRFLLSRSPWFTSQLGLEKPYLQKNKKQKTKKKKKRKRERKRKKGRKEGRKKGRKEGRRKKERKVFSNK